MLGAAQPAPAATIVSSQLNGNFITDFSGPGSLEVDPVFVNRGPIVLTVSPDANPLTFNSLVNFLLPFGVTGYTLGLTNATWNLIGSIDPLNATAFSVASTATNVAITFTPRELQEVDLGDIGFGGTDWRIAPAGGNFTLTLQAVPEPSTIALMACALVALVSVRQRMV